MRGLLIANPNATATDWRVRDVIDAAFQNVVGDLEVVTTTHRGHAGELAARAASDGTDVLITLGGDGTIHEVVNGLLNEGGPNLPVLATIPGGSANVFARACGLPNDPVQATGLMLRSLRQSRFRWIGLGRANGLWFTCNAGLGLDAEVIAAMERHRSGGKQATPTRYVATALTQYFGSTNRRESMLTVLPGNAAPVDHVFLSLVQNCSPWTYMGTLPVNACPEASFDSGLAVFALRDMGIIPSLRVTGRLLRGTGTKSRSQSAYLAHDLKSLTIVARDEVALQVDGEGLGHTRHVVFESVPNALRVLDVRGET